MMSARRLLFKDQQQLSLKQKIFKSVDADIMYGGGACGGYSKVLARHLQLAGYDVRIGQLKVPKVGYGGHIVVEYFSKDFQKWILVDPLFELFIKLPNGVPASIEEIKNNWVYCSKQMSPEYRKHYKYF
jgi:hypothetical protein